MGYLYSIMPLEANWTKWKPEIAAAMQQKGWQARDLKAALIALAKKPEITEYYPELADHTHAGRMGFYIYNNRKPPLCAYYNVAARDLPDAQPGKIKKMPEMIALALGVPYEELYPRPIGLPVIGTSLEHSHDACF